jgi:hypothetical protein
MRYETIINQGHGAISKDRKMRAVTFEISEEDFQVLSAIASHFYEGCFRGYRPMDVRDLAQNALLGRKESMAWVLKQLPSNVIGGPWSAKAI